ncbi:MAG TPA: outer membrane lipoprotein-sorting protein [Stenomitos sp.]
MRNRRASRVLGSLLAVGLVLAAPTAAGAKVDARSLIRQAETQYQGRSSHAIMHMKVVTASWTREMTLESWSQGRDKMLSKVLSPKKDAGVATLKVGSDLWNYLPKIDRLMKIPTSLMGDRWMGSHLTNDDLVKEQKIDEIYDFKVEKETAKEATIVATPRPDAPVVWGKIVYRLDLERDTPIRIRYFDEDGELARTLEFSDLREIDGRTVPTRLRFVPADPPGEYTELSYEKLDYDPNLPDGLFSIRSLRK